MWISPRRASRSACAPPYRTDALRGVMQVVETDDPGGARVQSEYDLLGASYAEAFDTVSRCASPASPSPAAAQTVPKSPHPPARPQPCRRSRARRAYTVDVDQWDYWFAARSDQSCGAMDLLYTAAKIAVAFLPGDTTTDSAPVQSRSLYLSGLSQGPLRGRYAITKAIDISRGEGARTDRFSRPKRARPSVAPQHAVPPAGLSPQRCAPRRQASRSLSGSSAETQPPRCHASARTPPTSYTSCSCLRRPPQPTATPPPPPQLGGTCTAL